MSVPRLRLFGPAADAAGRRADVVPGANVEQVLRAACARYGEPFATVAATCRVWVDGEDPDPAATLGEHDEVALLPPVSGG